MLQDCARVTTENECRPHAWLLLPEGVGECYRGGWRSRRARSLHH